MYAASHGRESKISLGDGSSAAEAAMFTDAGPLPLPTLGGESGGAPGRGSGPRFTMSHGGYVHHRLSTTALSPQPLVHNYSLSLSAAAVF